MVRRRGVGRPHPRCRAPLSVYGEGLWETRRWWTALRCSLTLTLSLKGEGISWSDDGVMGEMTDSAGWNVQLRDDYVWQAGGAPLSLGGVLLNSLRFENRFSVRAI